MQLRSRGSGCHLTIFVSNLIKKKKNKKQKKKQANKQTNKYRSGAMYLKIHVYDRHFLSYLAKNPSTLHNFYDFWLKLENRPVFRESRQNPILVQLFNHDVI